MRIAIVHGHPDAAEAHFCHALIQAYARGADEGGHDVRGIDVATLDFPLLRTKEDFEHGAVPPALVLAQEALRWAEHYVIVYPLWLGGMPALLKGFLEQVLRPDFAFDMSGQGSQRKLRGRSARLIVTMGMPAFVYRWYFGAHSVKSLERNVLAFVGIKPVRTTLIGAVEGAASRRQAWLAKVAELGRNGR
jgi:putative NADPH-quinone reductase